MKVSINGEVTEFDSEVTVKELVTKLGYINKGFAVAINTTFIAIDTYENTVIKDGDKIDILGPVQGG